MKYQIKRKALILGLMVLTAAIPAESDSRTALPALLGNHPVNRPKQDNSLMPALESARTVNGRAAEPFVDNAAGHFGKLLASDGAGDDSFGYNVAISGNTAIVGAYKDDVGNNGDQGSAYVFVRSGNTWVQQQQLTASDGAAGDGFGIGVAISGDTVIVTAFQDDVGANGNQGSAYVFVRNGTTWAEQQKLTASDGSGGDFFGFSVAISGESAIVGAYADDVGANENQGSAYVFERSAGAWTEQQKLTASDGAGTDLFGSRVAISGNTAIVGAVSDNVGANVDQGSAYVFVRSATTWTEQQKLTASDGAAGDSFGSVAISGDTAIVGAYRDRVGANVNQGSAYVFVRSAAAWAEQQKLSAADGAAGDFFGFSVAIIGDSAIVGAFGDDVGSNGDQGSAYVFFRAGTIWDQKRQLTASDGAGGDFFGFSATITPDTAFVGAYGDDIGTNMTQGSAYSFRVSERAPFDFDGDGKSDVSIFRPSSGQWWLTSPVQGATALTFGASTDRIVPADYTGDGLTDHAVFRPSDGVWYVLRSEDSSFYSFPFGNPTDIPAPADYDGDGDADPAVFRPETGTWYIHRSTGTTIEAFGVPGDRPVPADYDGDGAADIAIFRPSSGQWWLKRSTAGVVAVTFGTSTDKCVPGDYTGDGRSDVAIFRPSTGEWLTLRSEDFSFYSFEFGISTDTPAPGDYDGDGRFDAAVYRSSAAMWYVQRSTEGILIQPFGVPTDIAVPNAFVR